MKKQEGGIVKACVILIAILVVLSGTAMGASFDFREKENEKLTQNNENHPPYEPSNPNPPDGGIMTTGSISWTGGDPDLEDIVFYEIYFGETYPPNIVLINMSGTDYLFLYLDYNTTYYWKIVAWDNHGASTHGPIWNFTTMPDTPPPTAHIDPPVPDGENGMINNVYIISEKAKDKSGTLVNIEFTAQQKLGISDIVLEGVIVANENNKRLYLEVNDGTVMVE